MRSLLPPPRLTRRTIPWLCSFLCLLPFPVFAQETPTQLAVISVERIWDRPEHSAFTDLVRYRGDLYVAFREGSGHIPGRNGVIRILRSSDAMNWESFALLDEPHVDLRDPKLSVTPDGRLMVNSGASYYHDSKRLKIESRAAFLKPGEPTFGPLQRILFPAEIATESDWLWRVTWHDGWAWGCVQQVPDPNNRKLHLIRSRDGVRYEHVAALPVEYPSETTLRFQPDGTMVAMIRAEGPNPIGSIGIAAAPYTDWQITPSNKRVGGPDFVRLPNETWLASSREYGKVQTTGLWWLDVDSAKFTEILTLPSGGDTSYAGLLVEEDRNQVLVSYYSSHEGNTAIYLATLRLDALQEPALSPRESP